MQAKVSDSVRTGEVKGLVSEIIHDATNSGVRSHGAIKVSSRRSARHSGIILYDVSISDEQLLHGVGAFALTMFLFGHFINSSEKV